jgi:hypothetical protein
MIDLANNTIDLTLFKSVLKMIKQRPELAESLIDSFSDNQFKAKSALVSHLARLGILTTSSRVMLFGSWYGSIIIPLLLNFSVEQILAVDLDDQVIRVAKNQLFNSKNNIFYITRDVFSEKVNPESMNLYINTSCKHMLPMKDWGKFTQDSYFAFQSNNFYNIPGHINCVSSLEEFKKQMPNGSKILFQEEIDDTRGTRYMLVGQI